jgi:hypothetical protein
MTAKLQPIGNLGYKMFVMVFLITLLCTGQTISQQGRGSIRGLVRDEVTREPLIGANVFIQEINAGAATDVDGRFLIEGVPAVRILFL